MPVIQFILLWPLRQAALVPVFLISATAAGAAYGSLDRPRRVGAGVAARAAPRRAGAPPASAAASTAAALTAAAGVVSVREAVWAPRVPPPPALAVDAGPVLARLRNAAALFRHAIVAYPWAFRFRSAFAAGVAGGVAWTVAAARG